MHYLIDGYNLLHALGGMPSGRLGPTGLDKARLRLLGLLRAVYGEEAPRVTVVFDAAGARPGATEVHDYHGIEVRFAVRQPEADDLIEQLIGSDSAPKKLHVVSDDHRIQQAARRRHCQVLGCEAYLAELNRHCRRHRPHAPADTHVKPERLSEAETRHWLEEFAGLENDPSWKALWEMYSFGEDEP
jgi:predicted RNA-binding protein with PIN domain